MACSRFEYVKSFESHDKLLPGSWVIIRLDGRNFTNFAKRHAFAKPNDVRALSLMNAAATHVLRTFDQHLLLAFGQSDEFSFVLRRDSTLFGRRREKIVSTLVSLFSAAYVARWPAFFATNEQPLLVVPSFDARVVIYPVTKYLRDYLSWRQADVHVNNLYNTAFWTLVLKGGLSPQQAEQRLKGTLAADKHELLFAQFGINYNDESEVFRKGSLIVARNRLGGDRGHNRGDDECSVGHGKRKRGGEEVGNSGGATDAIGAAGARSATADGDASGQAGGEGGSGDGERQREGGSDVRGRGEGDGGQAVGSGMSTGIDGAAPGERGGDTDAAYAVLHVDIIGDAFWLQNPCLLAPSDLTPPRIRKL